MKEFKVADGWSIQMIGEIMEWTGKRLKLFLSRGGKGGAYPRRTSLEEILNVKSKINYNYLLNWLALKHKIKNC